MSPHPRHTPKTYSGMPIDLELEAWSLRHSHACQCDVRESDVGDSDVCDSDVCDSDVCECDVSDSDVCDSDVCDSDVAVLR